MQSTYNLISKVVGGDPTKEMVADNAKAVAMVSLVLLGSNSLYF